MNEQLREAIQERFDLGHNEQEIINELIATGYTSEDAARFVGMVKPTVLDKEVSEPFIATEDDLKKKEQKIESTGTFNDDTNEDSQSHHHTEGVDVDIDPEITDKQKRSHLGLVIILVVTLLLSGLAAFVYLTDFDFKRLLGLETAPYQDVQSLLVGASLYDVESMAFKSKFALTLEQREETTSTVFPEMFREFNREAVRNNIVISSDAHMIIEAEGKLEKTKEKDELPELDIKGKADFLFDIVNFKAGASLRVVDQNIYVKVDDLPGTMQGQLKSEGIPINEWILLSDDNQRFIKLMTQDVLRGRTDKILSLLPDILFAYGDGSERKNQLANVYDAIESLPPSQRAEVKRRLSDVVEMWDKYPFIKIDGKPKKQKLDGQTVYTYYLKIDEVNLVNFIKEIDSYVLREIGEDVDLIGQFNEVSGPEIVQKINELVTVRLDVLPDGTLYRYEFESVVTSPDTSFNKQIRLNMSTVYTQIGEDFDIEVPQDVYEKTIEEIAEDRMNNKLIQYEKRNKTIQLNNMRVQAEVYYNKHDFSYSGFCTSEDFLNSASGYKITCKDSKDKYFMFIGLDSDRYWCIDSTGVSKEFSEDEHMPTPNNVSCPR